MKIEALKLPRQAALSDGTEIKLRVLGRTDFEVFFAFTSSLPAHDLLGLLPN